MKLKLVYKYNGNTEIIKYQNDTELVEYLSSNINDIEMIEDIELTDLEPKQVKDTVEDVIDSLSKEDVRGLALEHKITVISDVTLAISDLEDLGYFVCKSNHENFREIIIDSMELLTDDELRDEAKERGLTIISDDDSALEYVVDLDKIILDMNQHLKVNILELLNFY